MNTDGMIRRTVLAVNPSDNPEVEALVSRTIGRESTITLLSYIETDIVELRARIETGKCPVNDLSTASRIKVYAAELQKRGY